MIDLKVKELFFDRAAVTSATDRGRVRALNRIGAYLRLTAKRSMRRRKGSSAPGEPQHAHTGLLRDHVYYTFDHNTNSVVIGPALLRTPGADDARPIAGTIPQTLEEGGAIRVRESGRGRTSGSRVRTVTVTKRPAMAPALEEAKRADKLSEFWKEVLK
jgi:hypothetical protein